MFLPLSGHDGLVAIIIITLLIATPWYRMKRVRIAVGVSLVLFFAVTLFGSYALPEGWSVCLKRLVQQETLTTPCEPTAQFRNGERSYMMRDISWQKNRVPIYFFNDKQAFNFYTDDEPNRTKLPYFLEIKRDILGGKNAEVTVRTWMAHSVLRVDDAEYVLERDRELRVPIPEARTHAVTFTTSHERANEEYLELHVIGSSSLAGLVAYDVIRYALIAIAFVALGYSAWTRLKVLSRASRLGVVALLIWALYSSVVQHELWLISFLVLIMVVLLWMAKHVADRFMLFPAITVLVFHAVRTIGRMNWTIEDTLIYELIFLPVLLWIIWLFCTRAKKERRILVPYVFLLLLLNTFTLIQHTHPIGSVVLYPGGNDELTHEGFARQSLLARDVRTWLVSGEDHVFYYQPMYRYLLAIIHAVFGESVFWPYVIQTTLMSIAVLTTVLMLRAFSLPYADAVFGIVVGIVSVRGEHSLFSLMQTAYQQGIALPILIISLGLLCMYILKDTTVKRLALLGVFLGLSYSLRTDFLPTLPIFFIGLVYILRTMTKHLWKKALIWFLGSLAIFPLLVVMRNYIIAHEFAFMPTSGLYNIIPGLDALFAGEDLRSYGTLHALGAIISHYINNISGLVSILWDNISSHFVGEKLGAQVLWIAGCISACISSLLLKGKERIVAICITLFSIIQIIPQSFFVQHNGIAMIGQYDYIWMTMFALSIGSLVRFRIGKPATVVALLIAIIFGVTSSSAHAALPPGFKVDPSYYPSSLNPNFLPNGTLVRTSTTPTVYYIKDGTRSMILPRIIELWLKEAHYLKPDLVTVISKEDMNRYKQVASVNPYYIGKILKHPDGRQFYIDDKLRKRPLSAAVRKALLYPSRNLYPTSAAHLNEFPTGLAITRTDVHPGGTVMYNGPYHGGTIWRVEQNSKGQLTKRFYLQDYLYEAEGYPWSGQIMPVTAAELARYPRGPHIERYIDGWIVGLNGKIYAVQKGTLRHIASPEIFKALGYNEKYVLKVFPEFLKKYPIGKPIAAFKNLTASASITTVATATSSTSVSTTSYPELRPAVAALIPQINDLFLLIYDRDPTAAENVFWTDYIYKGEVATKDALIAAMQKAKSTGVRPTITSRTAILSTDVLKSKWFPYLFYFVWYREPSAEAKAYWYGRIDRGDWNTIEGLGGTIRWLKDTSNLQYK